MGECGVFRRTTCTAAYGRYKQAYSVNRTSHVIIWGDIHNTARAWLALSPAALEKQKAPRIVSRRDAMPVQVMQRKPSRMSRECSNHHERGETQITIVFVYTQRFNSTELH